MCLCVRACVCGGVCACVCVVCVSARECVRACVRARAHVCKSVQRRSYHRNGGGGGGGGRLAFHVKVEHCYQFYDDCSPSVAPWKQCRL